MDTGYATSQCNRSQYTSGETLTEELSTSATVTYRNPVVPKQKQRNDIPVPLNGTEFIIQANEVSGKQEHARRMRRDTERATSAYINIFHGNQLLNMQRLQGIKKSMDGI
jgi:hypothetical protein